MYRTGRCRESFDCSVPIGTWVLGGTELHAASWRCRPAYTRPPHGMEYRPNGPCNHKGGDAKILGWACFPAVLALVLFWPATNSCSYTVSLFGEATACFLHSLHQAFFWLRCCPTAPQPQFLPSLLIDLLQAFFIESFIYPPVYWSSITTCRADLASSSFFCRGASRPHQH